MRLTLGPVWLLTPLVLLRGAHRQLGGAKETADITTSIRQAARAVRVRDSRSKFLASTKTAAYDATRPLQRGEFGFYEYEHDCPWPQPTLVRKVKGSHMLGLRANRADVGTQRPVKEETEKANK
ncbi:hypothetical protein BD289DRAFT_453069 [Coniella lustricola]|uniref:Uncharacterized protein n=1 Tax=Coniella lustricola TaxID=2025994 RepID=A0A2T3A906_9PEZI|nr:hypothetical protein BD289DRAFT_453069 [Coniella lustricola]